eukprot:1509183-Lingulodinium_polyedra.AAC.1
MGHEAVGGLDGLVLWPVGGAGVSLREVPKGPPRRAQPAPGPARVCPEHSGFGVPPASVGVDTQGSQQQGPCHSLAWEVGGPSAAHELLDLPGGPAGTASSAALLCAGGGLCPCPDRRGQ